MDNRDIEVSICCATYNHEKYIRETLEGFIAQKTNFRYEIIISDDLSTDHTRDILKEYEQKYPNLIRVIYQKENQYSKGKKIVFDILIPEVKGNYIALCEGDDYWTNPYKLQKQYDSMKQHRECTLCVHKVHDVDLTGNLLPNTYPKDRLDTGVIQKNRVMEMLFNPCRYWFHASSYFFKADLLLDYNGLYPDFITKAGVGDVPLTWLLGYGGAFFYIDEEMSCYRRDTEGSWSVKMQDRDQRRKMAQCFLESIKAYDMFTKGNYSNILELDICRAEFDYYRLNDDFWKMRNTKYRKFYQELSIRQKAQCLVLKILKQISNLKKNVK